MGRISRVASALISIAISVLTILFLYGYLAPLGLSTSILGPEYSNTFGAGGTSPYGALVPGGVVGLILFTILSRVGSVTGAVTSSSSSSSAEQMMRRMNFPGMSGAQVSAPATLPPDVTKSQYIVLRSYRQGYKNSKEVSKSLFMDRDEVQKDTESLQTNGYLSKNCKLTSKGMELLGS